MKKLIILRGLPGSGKSHAIRDLPSHAVICSADHFFMTDGHYNFDPSKLGLAHMLSQAKALDAMSTGEPLVVVDNTNSCHWEYYLYQRMGDLFGYHADVRTVGGRSPEDVALYAERNIHGVPLEVIQKMADRWED